MHWRPHIPSSSSSTSSHTTATSSASLNQQTQRHLARAKKLRHLQDDDIKDLDSELLRSSSTPIPPSAGLNSATSTGRYHDLPRWSVDSHVSTNNSKLGRVAPVALPQPLPLPTLGSPSVRKLSPSPREGGNRGDKEKGRGWEREKGKTREKELERSEEALAREGVLGIPIDIPNGRPIFHQDTMSSDVRGSVDHAHPPGFSRHALPSTRPRDKAQSHISIHVPSSAPGTRYSSPAISPHTMSTGDTSSSSAYHIPPPHALWSCPEMPQKDMACGFPFTPLQDRPSTGFDCSPVQSPHFSRPRPTSPIRPMLSIDTSMIRQENHSVLSSGHRLPLPPGASVLPQSSLVPQRTPKPELLQQRGQWIKGKLIGRGTFGSVYAATHRETGALCAMKEVEICPDDPKAVESMKQLEQEIKVLSHLKHPNIVQYYGSEMVDDRFYIFLEYVYPGSICKYVREHCGAMTESVVRNFTRHILSGLAYLHSTKTIHRDIKGANLLVDAFGVVKLADFGMAKHLTGQAAELSLKGSPYWMAPELMQAVMQKDSSPELALAVDIWSLGCTVIEMFTGKPPWHEYEGAAAMFKVMKESPPIPENMSAEGKCFLRCCFRRNPAERATANMLLEHRFVKNSQPLDLPVYLHSPSGLNMLK